jgi:hypothetical protein
MRHAKIFTLAVIGIAAMALINGSTAMAESTLLCTEDPELSNPGYIECLPPAEIHFLSVKVVLVDHQEIVEDSPITLLTNFVNIQCEMLLRGEVLDQLVANGPVRVSVPQGGLVFAECDHNCTMQAVEGGELLILKEAPEAADVKTHELAIKVNCAFLKCTYDWEGVFGLLLGALIEDTGERGHLEYPEQILHRVGGLLCPTVTVLDALLQSLEPIHIRS